MQKTTSQKALKVISIIMIVFAALTLLLGIGGIVTGGALGILGAGIGDARKRRPRRRRGSRRRLRHPPRRRHQPGHRHLRPARSQRPAQDRRVLRAGHHRLAFAVLSALGTFFGGSADGGDIASALFGLVLPLVCVLLAYNIKKENNL